MTPNENWAVIQVIGTIWMPAVEAATEYKPWGSDIANMRAADGVITRESFSLWLDTHSGDFQTVKDFSAVIRDAENEMSYEFNWEKEESELRFSDLMFPDEDDD